MSNWIRALSISGLGMAAALPGWAQCAMCREAAASQNAQAIHALNAGILVLGIPPAAIAAAIGWVTYRQCNSTDGGAEEE